MVTLLTDKNTYIGQDNEYKINSSKCYSLLNEKALIDEPFCGLLPWIMLGKRTSKKGNYFFCCPFWRSFFLSRVFFSYEIFQLLFGFPLTVWIISWATKKCESSSQNVEKKLPFTCEGKFGTNALLHKIGVTYYLFLNAVPQMLCWLNYWCGK